MFDENRRELARKRGVHNPPLESELHIAALVFSFPDETETRIEGSANNRMGRLFIEDIASGPSGTERPERIDWDEGCVDRARIFFAENWRDRYQTQRLLLIALGDAESIKILWKDI